MRILIDTHVFIWINDSPEQLSKQALADLSDLNNSLILSLVSVWEMQIKVQLGKLRLDTPLPELLTSQQQVNGLQLLTIKLEHIWSLEGLPTYHRDPFDRLLVAQAIVETLPMLSADQIFDQYPVQRLW